MSDFLSIAAHAAAYVASAILVFMAIFLREDEEGVIQNKLETLWVRSDDLSRGAVSMHTAFLRTAASATAGALRSLFGDRALSWQFVGVSACLSLASLYLVAALAYLPRMYAFPLMWEAVFNAAFTPPVVAAGEHRLAAGVGLAFVAGLPLLSPRLRHCPAIIAALVIILSAIVLPAWSTPTRSALVDAAFTTIAVLGGVACDVVFVATSSEVLNHGG